MQPSYKTSVSRVNLNGYFWNAPSVDTGGAVGHKKHAYNAKHARGRKGRHSITFKRKPLSHYIPKTKKQYTYRPSMHEKKRVVTKTATFHKKHSSYNNPRRDRYLSKC